MGPLHPLHPSRTKIPTVRFPRMTLPTYESADTMTGIVIDESVFFIDGFGKKGKRNGFNNVNNAADGRLTLRPK